MILSLIQRCGPELGRLMKRDPVVHIWLFKFEFIKWSKMKNLAPQSHHSMCSVAFWDGCSENQNISSTTERGAGQLGTRFTHVWEISGRWPDFYLGRFKSPSELLFSVVMYQVLIFRTFSGTASKPHEGFRSDSNFQTHSLPNKSKGKVYRKLWKEGVR